MCRGNLQELEQMVGVVFVRDKVEIILQRFEPDISTRGHIEQLNGIADRINFTEKWYRHLCYCFEYTYGILLDTRANISSNRGFEWQLK